MASTPPTARKPYLVTQISRDIAKFRGHVLHHPAIVPPIVPPIPPRVRRKFSFAHDETIEKKNSRLHEQQVAKFLNQLMLTGQLIGTPQDPSLAYLAADPTMVGTTDVIPLKDALDIIFADIKALDAELDAVAATVPTLTNTLAIVRAHVYLGL